MKIKDVATIQAGTGFPERYQGNKNLDYGFYKVGDISKAWLSSSDYLLDAEHEISKKIVDEIRGAIIPPHSIVFAKIGEALKLNRRALTKQECLVDNNVFALIPNDEKTVPKFLYYYSRTLDFSKLCRATTVPSLRKGDIEEIEFPDFEKGQQMKIVRAIETQFTRLDVAIKSLRAIKVKLELYRKSVLKAAFFNELISIKGEWDDVQIKDIAHKIQYGLTSRSGGNFSGPKYLRITDIQDRCVNWDSVPLAEQTEELENYLLRKDDLVFARTGATVGKSFLIDEPPKNAVFASYLIRIVPDTNKINPGLLWYYFQSPMYWHQISGSQRGIGQPNVNGQILAGLNIRFPKSIKEQDILTNEIESRVSVIDKLDTVIDNSLAKAETLRKSILKSAFGGRLV